MTNDLEYYNPQRTYDAAAREYDDAVEAFWGICADQTVKRLRLQPGEKILDIACGPGPVTLRAAELVGPGGSALGIDISSEMLSIAKGHALASGLSNIEFRYGDMDHLSYDAGSFDVVACVLGLFFARDIVSVARSMWEITRPGGRVAVTTLGDKFFFPMFEAFLDGVRVERPGLELSIPWRRTEDPRVLLELLEQAGWVDMTVTHDDAMIELPAPTDWWRIVRGTGIRRIEMELGQEASARVRAMNEDLIRREKIRHIQLGVNYALAVKPGTGLA